MTPRSPLPPLINGIDEIVSRPPKEVEPWKQPGNKIRQIYRKYQLRKRDNEK